MRALRLAWAAPWTAIGLALAPFFRTRRIDRGVIVCEGAAWPRRIGWRYRAITLGHVILCVDRVDDALLAHELVHVRQYERWGPFFIPAYVMASGWARVRGGRAYADNPFELAARDAAEPSRHGSRV